jgi:hypothetical protein
MQNGYHSHLYFPVFAKVVAFPKSPQTKYRTLFWLMYSQRIDTSWQGKNYGSMAQAKVHSFEPESLSFIVTLGTMSDSARIITNEVPTVTNINMPS